VTRKAQFTTTVLLFISPTERRFVGDCGVV
jgi:hypothetical protein